MNDRVDTGSVSVTVKRPVRIGMVGGGSGAFIGAVHRHALAMDAKCSLVCGAFSSDGHRSRTFGVSLGLDESRAYGSYADMFAGERGHPDGMEAVAIVTPNHLHLPVALAALEAGYHVISDKPATLDLAEAKVLASAVHGSDKLYAITHTYLGYPMVREARSIVESGELGKIRKVYVEYTQGWLAQPIEGENKQASWRSDPAQSGIAGCMGDIGSHAHNLAEYIVASDMTEVRAWLQNVVPGRALDDDGAVFCRFENGATGVLTASQVCAGEENLLRIRVYGECGGLEWNQEEPNTVLVKYGDGRQHRLRAGSNMPLGPVAASMCRTPSGHPGGYLEAFASIYSAFAGQIRGHLPRSAGALDLGFVPGIRYAVRGMSFIEAVVESSAVGGEWRSVTDG